MFEHECLIIVFDIIILTLLFWHYYYFDIMTGVVAGGGRCFETRFADHAEPRSATRHERTGEPPQRPPVPPSGLGVGAGDGTVEAGRASMFHVQRAVAAGTAEEAEEAGTGGSAMDSSRFLFSSFLFCSFFLFLLFSFFLFLLFSFFFLFLSFSSFFLFLSFSFFCSLSSFSSVLFLSFSFFLSLSSFFLFLLSLVLGVRSIGGQTQDGGTIVAAEKRGHSTVDARGTDERRHHGTTTATCQQVGARNRGLGVAIEADSNHRGTPQQ